MPTGTVIFLLERGFGFIKPESGDKDIFFHRSKIAQDIDSIRRGTRVTYELGSPHKGRAQAVHVKLIDQPKAEPTDDGSQALAWNRTKERSQ